MTKKPAQYSIFCLLLALLAGCSGVSQQQEAAAEEVELTMTQPDGDDMPAEPVTLSNDESESPSQADDTTTLPSEFGTATQALRRTQCCDCTADAAGECTGWSCYPCQD